MSVCVSVFVVGLFLQVQNIPQTMVTISKEGSPQCNYNDSTTNKNNCKGNCLTGSRYLTLIRTATEVGHIRDHQITDKFSNFMIEYC